MDIPRAPTSKRRKNAYVAVLLGFCIIAFVAIEGLRPAPPVIERSSLVIDSVRRGDMIRDVRGPGALVAENVRWVSAETAGRVERIYAQPGASVSEASLLIDLSNPDVQLEALSADQAVSAAEAALVSLQTDLALQRLGQETTVAETRSEYRQASRIAAASESLAKKGFLAPMDVSKARDKEEELNARMSLEQRRLDVISQSMERQIALQRTQVDRLHAVAKFQHERIASMHVVAGVAGVVQDLAWGLGQWVTPGAILAKITEPTRLKAVLRIPETQAKDIQLGQSASIDTRNGVIAGHVARIDPASQNGSVAVDIALNSPLPKGARPDLAVEGSIEIERLRDVLYVSRPTSAEPESVVSLFRLTSDGKEAVRVSVKVGRASSNAVEVLQGLGVGDKIVISDMTSAGSHDRVALN